MKVLAQQEGWRRPGNMPLVYTANWRHRGRSAYVFQMGEQWGAFITGRARRKSLIAQAIYKDHRCFTLYGHRAGYCRNRYQRSCECWRHACRCSAYTGRQAPTNG